MIISLTPDQLAWLDARVARGEFASVDEAARRLIGNCIAEEGDDLDWAARAVDEALAAVARGEVISRDDHRARNAVRLTQ